MGIFKCTLSKVESTTQHMKMAGKGEITTARHGRRREHPQHFVLLRGKPSLPVANFR